DRLDDEHEERRSAHAPRVRQRDALLADADRVEVEEEVREHHHHAVAPIDRHRVAEHAFPELRLGDLVNDGHGRPLVTNPVRCVPHTELSMSTAWCIAHTLPILAAGLAQTVMKLSGSSHCPSSCWKIWLLSTMIWPSSASTTLNRSSGRGAGP